MPPLHIMIKPVSGACNLHCRYCFYADEMHHRGQAVYPPMTQKTLEAVVRRTLIHADGAVTFMFQGGEPTLAGLPFYEALTGFVQRYNGRHLPVQYALQTNGYALSDEMIAFLPGTAFCWGFRSTASRPSMTRSASMRRVSPPMNGCAAPSTGCRRRACRSTCCAW